MKIKFPYIRGIRYSLLIYFFSNYTYTYTHTCIYMIVKCIFDHSVLILPLEMALVFSWIYYWVQNCFLQQQIPVRNQCAPESFPLTGPPNEVLYISAFRFEIHCRVLSPGKWSMFFGALFISVNRSLGKNKVLIVLISSLERSEPDVSFSR